MPKSTKARTQTGKTIGTVQALELRERNGRAVFYCRKCDDQVRVQAGSNDGRNAAYFRHKTRPRKGSPKQCELSKKH
jgi:hypothetical protein